MFDNCLLYDHNYYNSDLRSDYKTFQSYLYFGNINSEHLYIVYGGSTSSTIIGSYWAEYLQEYFDSKGISACVFNGACCGHNSWNEMNKLIRDIAVFSSTLSRAAKSVTIISYSGINDFAGSVSLEHPNVNMRGINEISGLEIFTGVNCGSIYHNHSNVF